MRASPASLLNSSLIRFDRPSHWSSVSSELATFENCSNSGWAYRSMPGIALTSSSAVRRPPVRLEIVPPVATSRTRGSAASCAAAAAAAPMHSPANATLRRTRHLLIARLFSGAGHLDAKRVEVPVEEGPHAVPRVALLAGVLRLPGRLVHAAIEGVPARRVVVHLGFGERRLARAQRVDELHVFLDVHVLVVARHVDEQPGLRLC